MTDDGRNGHRTDLGHGAELDDEPDDDAPLDEAEATEGAAAAAADTGESMDDRIGAVLDDLDSVTRDRNGEAMQLAVAGRVFAVLGPDGLEVELAGPVAAAALATPDTRPSTRGAGWVLFTPAVSDRFALDRAEAWVRFAHRRASGSRPG